MEYLGHDFVWIHFPNLIGLRYKCSICGIFADKYLKKITLINEEKFVEQDISCNEYIIKKLIE